MMNNTNNVSVSANLNNNAIKENKPMNDNRAPALFVNIDIIRNVPPCSDNLFDACKRSIRNAFDAKDASTVMKSVQVAPVTSLDDSGCEDFFVKRSSTGRVITEGTKSVHAGLHYSHASMSTSDLLEKYGKEQVINLITRFVLGNYELATSVGGSFPEYCRITVKSGMPKTHNMALSGQHSLEEAIEILDGAIDTDIKQTEQITAFYGVENRCKSFRFTAKELAKLEATLNDMF